MSRVFIGVGSNEGDRLAIISSAIKQLGRLPGIAVTQMATILETEPVGPPQEPYLNTVVELDTTCSPRELLAALQALERAHGRMPSAVRWAPRPLDLDLLLYDDQVVRETGLVIPHARMHERRFVLEPLAQLAPNLTHPVLGDTITQLLANLHMENSKHQIPNPKQIPNSKSQTLNVWCLVLGVWCLCGAWCLGLGASHAGC